MEKSAGGVGIDVRWKFLLLLDLKILCQAAKNRTTFLLHIYWFISFYRHEFIITILCVSSFYTNRNTSKFFFILFYPTHQQLRLTQTFSQLPSGVVLSLPFFFTRSLHSLFPPTSLLPQTTINYKITWVAFLQNYSTAGEKKKKEFLW